MQLIIIIDLFDRSVHVDNKYFRNGFLNARFQSTLQERNNAIVLRTHEECLNVWGDMFRSD